MYTGDLVLSTLHFHCASSIVYQYYAATALFLSLLLQFRYFTPAVGPMLVQLAPKWRDVFATRFFCTVVQHHHAQLPAAGCTLVPRHRERSLLQRLLQSADIFSTQ